MSDLQDMLYLQIGKKRGRNLSRRWNNYLCLHRSHQSQTPHHHGEDQPWVQVDGFPHTPPEENMYCISTIQAEAQMQREDEILNIICANAAQYI